MRCVLRVSCAVKLVLRRVEVRRLSAVRCVNMVEGKQERSSAASRALEPCLKRHDVSSSELPCICNAPNKQLARLLPRHVSKSASSLLLHRQVHVEVMCWQCEEREECEEVARGPLAFFSNGVCALHALGSSFLAHCFLPNHHHVNSSCLQAHTRPLLKSSLWRTQKHQTSRACRLQVAERVRLQSTHV